MAKVPPEYGASRSAEPSNDMTDRPEFGMTTRVATYGAVMLFLALLGLVAFAPISGGALAVGTVNPEGARRVVQHYEGGIIAEILIRDGDLVAAGDPLVVLDSTQASADRNISRARLQTLKIIEARLRADMRGDRTMDLSSIDFSIDPRLVDTARSETELLQKSFDLIEAQLKLLDERESQFNSEIQGLRAGMASLSSQLELLKEEISSAQILVDKELYAIPRFLALRREEVSLSGQIRTHEASILRIEGQIRETEVQRSELRANRRSEIAQQLSEVRREKVQTEEVLATNEFTLKRTTVISPIDGTVVALRFRTLGGVVGPGEPIVDIVPASDELIIEAQVNPSDVDVISPGLPAQVTFSTLRRDLPQIYGYVKTISADALVEERSGATFFKVEIIVPRDELEDLDIADKLTPGIPVDVTIVTESRTILQYLMQPLSDSMRRAFKESN